MLQLAVPDARRLVEATARLHQHASDAFVLEQHPALEHVHELHRAVVQMPLAVRRLPGARADDVGDDLAPRRALDAEIAIFEIAPQAAAREPRALQMFYLEMTIHPAGILR